MDEIGFREWLSRRIWNDKPLSKKGIDNRIRRLRRVERSLIELGFGTDSIDNVIANGRIDDLSSRVRQLIRRSPSKDGLPGAMVPQADNPVGQLRNILAVIRLYSQFATASDPSAADSATPIERLREAFLERCPDFDNFEQSEGTYWELERQYKDAIIAKVRDIRESDAPVSEIGKPLYEAMMPNAGPLLRWETRDDVERNHAPLAPEFFEVIGELSRAENAVEEAIVVAASRMQSLRARGINKLTNGEILAIAFTTAACSHPNVTAPFKIRRAQKLAQKLTGKAIFPVGALELSHVQQWHKLLREVKSQLNAWGWKPRDLFDVQGFAWVALGQEAETDDDWDEDDEWDALNGDAAPVRFWIEKTIVSSRPDRLDGEHALGKALWSPQRSKDGRDIYSSMTQVRPGDVVFHLTDNSGITDVSIANDVADGSFRGVEGTEWADQDGYRIPLKDHKRLEPPLEREAFLATEPYKTELAELIESGAKGLFYNRRLELNQGAYLTEVTPSLLSILDRAYREVAGRSLPYVSQTPDDDRSNVVGDATVYTLEDALEDLFIDRALAENIMLLWRAKKNVILQGPPGVGKSYAAQRLAFALMGARDRDRLGFVQFHQSYSYEDFVEGFRPTETGFALKAGKFVEFCRRAESDPNRSYVFIIDEINRGNLSKILGELMLLIEHDKRDPEWAMPLASGRATFHVPANVFLLGLMNTADRSLAVVDYALRRRFAFIDLAPNLSSSKFRDELARHGISQAVLDHIIDRIGELNAEIIGDAANLGPGFAIGHSFFCSAPDANESDTQWYERIILTEISPLLREYWFDAPDRADRWTQQLLSGL